jgi:hypothetical protein
MNEGHLKIYLTSLSTNERRLLKKPINFLGDKIKEEA